MKGKKMARNLLYFPEKDSSFDTCMSVCVYMPDGTILIIELEQWN